MYNPIIPYLVYLPYYIRMKSMHIQLFWFNAASNWLKIRVAKCNETLFHTCFDWQSFNGINKWKKKNDHHIGYKASNLLDFIRVLK